MAHLLEKHGANSSAIAAKGHEFWKPRDMGGIPLGMAAIPEVRLGRKGGKFEDGVGGGSIVVVVAVPDWGEGHARCTRRA